MKKTLTAQSFYAGKNIKMLIAAAKDMKDVDAVILAVAHREYVKWGLEKIASLCRKNRAILLDIKSVFDPAQAKSLGIEYWRL